ncbi:MAG TPA: T9SS type A sorting domain-containing protein [Chitinophagaceae bacterium]|jgi:hypothetical protein|nr:T9SS type A sorting domain-containing protein [Chitinophagaceae bacterium]
MKNRILIFMALFCMLGSSPFISCSLHEYKEGYDNEEMEEREEEEEEGEEEENGADKQLSAWFQTKGYPDASNMTAKYAAAWDEFNELKKNSIYNGHARTEAYGNWTHIGPKAFGGRILTLAINPKVNAAAQRTIFAGSAGGGIWKTYVSGVGASAWQRVVTNTHLLGVSSIVYHPTDTSIILAGTGEVYRMENYASSPYSSNQVSNIGRNAWKARGTYGVGILRSADAGNTWAQVLIRIESDLFGVQKIKFHPAIAGTVFACATDGLYKSTDNGLTWVRIWTGTYCSDIVINPADPTQIVIAAGNVTNNPKGVWRSVNSGTSFTQITGTGFPAFNGYKGFTNFTLLGSTIIASVGVGDNNNDNNFTENEVYRSTDFGATWNVVSASSHAQWQSWFAHGVTAYPGATDKVFMFGVKKYVLTMAGNTGTRTAVGTGAASAAVLTDGSSEGTNYLHDDVHEVQFVPGDNNTAYWATDGGVFRTTNANAAVGSITFSSCNGGLYAQQFFPTIAQSQITASNIIGGLQDNGVIHSVAGGWIKEIGGDGTTCVYKPDNENIVLASRDTREVNRSTDGGNTFSSTPMVYLGNVPGGYDDRTAFCSPVVVAPSNTNRWYVGSDNIHISNDAGASFTGNTSPPGTSYIEGIHKPAAAIGVSYQVADKLYISVSPFAQNLLTDGLYYSPPATIRKSTNGGGSFTTVTTGLPDRIVTDFAVSPTNDDSVFVTLGGFGSTHIYVTGDGGTSWTPRGSGLPDLPFNTLMFDQTDRRILYAGCDYGVYVSQDRGATWYDFSNGMWDATYAMDLVTAPGGKIRVATHGKGIFETDRWVFLPVLPVHFISFTGINHGAVNDLTWIVDEENQLLRYEVQRSIDGLNYQTIKQVAPRNSTSQTIYTAADIIGSNPLPNYYYRIRSVNLDGTYMFSDIIVIRLSSKAKFEVLGNPFQNSLTIRYTVGQTCKMQLNLLDLQGRFLRREELVAGIGTGTYTINNLSALPAGMYLLNADMNNTRTTIKVLKR